MVNDMIINTKQFILILNFYFSSELPQGCGAQEGCLGGNLNEAAQESGVEVPAAADFQRLINS